MAACAGPFGGHVIVAGLGYGDEGKGSVVDFLCSPRSPAPGHAVVRYNGGGQAGHNVVTEDGRHHTFAQFGAGTFHGAITFLSRYVLADPLTMLAEAAHLQETGCADPVRLLAVDAEALLITPYHVLAGRARELRRSFRQRHGSCGMGIGETRGYALAAPGAAPRWGDLQRPDVLTAKLAVLRDTLGPVIGPGFLPAADDLARRLSGREVRILARRTTVSSSYLAALLSAAPVIFEGAQGVLLDEKHGFAPYVTWTRTTFENAEELLREQGHTAARLGVTRMYCTRHGPGPFPSEDTRIRFPEPHNETGPWQGAFRQGHLDLAALRYALAVAGGADALAVTHADADATSLQACYGYRSAGDIITDLTCWRSRCNDMTDLTCALAAASPVYGIQPGTDEISEFLETPVAVVSRGPSADAKTVAACPALA